MITPDKITSLEPNEIFVFGSNLSGAHGAGAARTALQWGAVLGQGVGSNGQTYAIPTKNADISATLSLEEIKPYVDGLIQYAKQNTNKVFLVTEIGCGLAGLTPEQVAPLFEQAALVSNIYLPKRFWDELFKNNF